MSAAIRAAGRWWNAFRAILGDDAYERYLRHARRRHPETVPFTRDQFQRAELDRRWSQVNRCC